MNFRGLILLPALLTLAWGAAAQEGMITVASPDGRIQMTIATVAQNSPSPGGGQLAYRVSFAGKPVFHWSQMGLELEGQPVLGAKVRMVSSRTASADETWRLVVGKSSSARNHYNAAVLELEELAAPKRRFSVEARVFDDGAAFRYSAPSQTGLQEVRLASERTRFNFAKDATTYPLILGSHRTSYEDNYVKLPLSALKPDSLAALPLLAEVPGSAWVAITEAHLENYAGMYLVHPSARELESRLAPHIDNPKIAVATPAPMQSPWRVIMIADHPGRFVESNIVLNLNPPPAIADTSWIKAGRSAWNWWSGSYAEGNLKPGMNNDTIRYYIDFASSAKFEYMLIDAGWAAGTPGSTGSTSAADITRSNPNINIPELVEHARQKNVKLWLWAHWTSVDKQMNEAFPLFEKWGIAGVKIDFMDRDDQWMVDWYRRVVKKAAEHRLMIDFHGAFKPDGLRRTYPNLVTREGILGLENNKWSARDTPEHRVMLVFTRLLAGPGDFTPGGFNNVTREEFESRNRQPMVMGTRSQQTALLVLFESPFQCVADWPGAYAGTKELEFLRVVPATWDETRFLEGHPDSHAVVARRSGKEWYVGAITNWNAREVALPLRFLEKGSYIAEIYRDAPDSERNPKNSVKEEQKVTAASTLKLRLVSGGGAVIRIRPAK